MSKPYDYIIVLATQPDTETWEFPKQIHQCLDTAKRLLEKGTAPYIITSGDRAIGLDNRGIKQPFRECDQMKKTLVEKGVPADKILVEGESRDTISNLYFIKKNYLIPTKATSILFVVASFRVPRLKFLCKRILGDGYSISFKKIPAKMGPSYNEKRTKLIQSLFLEPMQDGDHSWLDGRFFDSWQYRYWRERAKDERRR